MEILYTDYPVLDLKNIKKMPSLFTAGPSPRSIDVPSWRPKALEILENRGFKGRVWVPEWKDPKNHVSFDFDNQVEWEKAGLLSSDVILFCIKGIGVIFFDPQSAQQYAWPLPCWPILS